MISDHSLYTKIKIPINFAGTGGDFHTGKRYPLAASSAADPFGKIVATRVQYHQSGPALYLWQRDDDLFWECGPGGRRLTIRHTGFSDGDSGSGSRFYLFLHASFAKKHTCF